MKYGRNMIVWDTFLNHLLRISFRRIATNTARKLPSMINARLYRIVFFVRLNSFPEVARNSKLSRPINLLPKIPSL